jgi:hypothetical protein
LDLNRASDSVNWEASLVTETIEEWQSEPAIGLATVLKGAVAFKVGNVSDTYVGPILLSNGQIQQAIIKDLPTRELANELMAATLSSAVGLPIPSPYIVAAASADLAASKGPALEDGRQLLFATVDAQTPSLRQILLASDPTVYQRLIERLLQWSHVGLLYGFDSLTANVDRHPGNLLFGGAEKVWLIDHGHCFTGPTWQPRDLDASSLYADKLKQWLTPYMDEGVRQTRASEAQNVVSLLGNKSIEELAQLNRVSTFLSEQDFAALVQFLNERKQHVPRLAANALSVTLLT